MYLNQIICSLFLPDVRNYTAVSNIDVSDLDAYYGPTAAPSPPPSPERKKRKAKGKRKKQWGTLSYIFISFLILNALGTMHWFKLGGIKRDKN